FAQWLGHRSPAAAARSRLDRSAVDHDALAVDAARRLGAQVAGERSNFLGRHETLLWAESLEDLASLLLISAGTCGNERRRSIGHLGVDIAGTDRIDGGAFCGNFGGNGPGGAKEGGRRGSVSGEGGRPPPGRGRRE